MQVLLLDAYNLIHRAKSGFTKGDNSIVYNFFRGLRPLVEKFNPDKVYFVLEGYPKFRSLIDNEYKSNRKKQDDFFINQKNKIINIVSECFPFEIVRHPDLECDDVIATLAASHCKKGDQCTIISSDSDFIQILNIFENVVLYNPVKKMQIDCPAYDYVTWKALKGDSSDNIAGIRGVGDKTAEKLLADSDRLSAFLQNESNRQIFERNVNLIRLVDFSEDMGLLERHAGQRDFKQLDRIFSEMMFSSILKKSTWEKYVCTFDNL